MDCFYAAVEIRDNPSLKNKPVAVGGSADSRGVLCTCNYVAREYGLHSAMPSAHAKRLCPQLVILPVNFPKYRASSNTIQDIFSQYTDVIEPLSLDEAFLDISDSHLHSGSATLIAKEIRQRIFQEERLTASAGIAPNKMLAKIASDWKKPNNQFVITPSEISAFMKELPVNKLFGVGKVTNEKMKSLGILTCTDLQALSPEELQQLFGKYGSSLYKMARGIDNRAVQTKRIRKSLSVERTFAKNMDYNNVLTNSFQNIYDELITRLNNLGKEKQTQIKSIFVKIKFSDFTLTTIQSSATELSQLAFKQLFITRCAEISKSIRLIGFGVHFDDQAQGQQLQFQFDENLSRND